MSKWNLSDIPELSGKNVVVTGGNVGLGYKSALELARKGACVIIGCRRLDSGKEAIHKIKLAIPNANIFCISLDLTNLKSIELFASKLSKKIDKLDILINNAGVVNLESLTRTESGDEMHMATNHYGHFSLTYHLLPLLCRSESARVVTVTSSAHNMGELRFDDMDWVKRPYSRTKSYGDSKLANLLFTLYLQKYSDDTGKNIISVASHPGLTGTERQQAIGIGGKFSKFLASKVSSGVLPQLRAATDPRVKSGDFYGPKFFIRGPACKLKLKGDAVNFDLAEKLWKFTESHTGCYFSKLK